MEQKNQRQGWDIETIVFVLFLTGMAVYYGWRMAALTPWYDELYTYYYFISRGPLYAAIHWPVPNNHIGYSVLSACLNVFGSSTIALRGISYLCSLGGFVLLYRIGRQCFERGIALVPVFLYAGMKLTNQLAVQGRGYALVTFCYLLSLWMLVHIAVEDENKLRDYVIFGVCLVIALYAIPSSVYMVVPVCLTGGAVLLVRKRYQTLVRLILTSVASAVCTAGLYGIVWLAIGSNLLMKTEGSAFYGTGHVSIILHAPFQALQTGIDYMLATPYIQSVDRAGFWARFPDWLLGLLNEYYIGAAPVLAVLLLVCVCAAIVFIVRKIMVGTGNAAVEAETASDIQQTLRHDAYDLFVELYLAVGIVCVPLMLTIQCSLPYYRVFSFAGVTTALALTWLLQMLFRIIAGRFAKKSGRAGMYFGGAGVVLAGICCVLLLFTPSYRAQYSDREAAIEDAYRHVDVAGADKIGVTDCDQEYLLLFLYDIGEERITRQPEEAQLVLADKYLLLGYETDITDWSGDDWKLYLTPEQFEASGVARDREAVYENDRFIVYANK